MDNLKLVVTSMVANIDLDEDIISEVIKRISTHYRIVTIYYNDTTRHLAGGQQTFVVSFVPYTSSLVSNQVCALVFV